MHTASRLLSGKATIEPGTVTQIAPVEQRSMWMLITNTLDVPLGVGGALLDTDQTLAPGDSVTLWICNPAEVHALHHDESPGDVHFTIGV